METITIKAVFDRKKVADDKSKKGLVQIRVTVNRKQVFVSTGIKVFKNQWDEGKERVKDCAAWYYAKENGYVLITGDGQLRRKAIASKVTVRGG